MKPKKPRPAVFRILVAMPPEMAQAISRTWRADMTVQNRNQWILKALAKELKGGG